MAFSLDLAHSHKQLYFDSFVFDVLEEIGLIDLVKNTALLLFPFEFECLCEWMIRRQLLLNVECWRLEVFTYYKKLISTAAFSLSFEFFVIRQTIMSIVEEMTQVVL